MKLTKIFATLTALVLLAAMPVLALAEDFGSAGVTQGETYTLEQMLTYAMQDEYMAQAEYAAIIAEYGDSAPFANIINAEKTHIALLTPLFETYGLTLPENTATAKVTLPASLQDAYIAGIAVENTNMAMYDAFLSQSDLPQDVRDVFVALKNASSSHLAAFTQNAEKTGLGMRNGQNNDDGDTANGNGNGRNSRNTGSNTRMGSRNAEDCPLGEDCLADGTQCGMQTRRGGKN